MRILIFMLVMLTLTETQAQHVFHSLEEIWAYAEVHSVQIITGLNNKTIVNKSIDRAYGALLPTLTASGSFTDNIQIQPTLVPAELFGGEPGTYREEQFGKRYIYNAGLTAQLDLVNTNSWYTIKSARLDHESAVLSLVKTKQDLYRQLADAYYSYLLRNEALALAKESLAIADETHQTIYGKYTEGQASEVTLNTTQINLKKADIGLNTALQNKTIALNNLKQLLDLSPTDSFTLEADTLILTPAKQQVDMDFVKDTEIKLAYSKMLAAKTNWQSAKASYTPTLSAVYYAGKQLAGDDFFNFENTSNLPQQYWGLRLTIPILSGSTRAYQNAKTKIEFDTQQRVYENTVRSSQINDQDLILAYRNAYTSCHESREILELYRQNDLHANRKLQEGLISIDERLRTYQDFITYQNDYLQVLSEYFIQYYSVQVRQKNF